MDDYYKRALKKDDLVRCIEVGKYTSAGTKVGDIFRVKREIGGDIVEIESLLNPKMTVEIWAKEKTDSNRNKSPEWELFK